MKHKPHPVVETTMMVVETVELERVCKEVEVETETIETIVVLYIAIEQMTTIEEPTTEETCLVEMNAPGVETRQRLELHLD